MAALVRTAEKSPATCLECGARIEPLILTIEDREHTIYPACQCQVDRWQRAEAAEAARARIARARKLYESSRLGSQYQGCTFDNFEVDPGNREAFEAAREFAARFPGDGRGLLIMGGVGAGKTHLAAAIALQLLAEPRPVIFVSSPELLETFRAAAGDEIPESTSTLMAQVQTADLLVLDDVGAERLTEWAEEKLFLIIDYRYRNNLPVAVTTNCSLDELAARIHARIFSRLFGMTRQVALKSPDRRLSQKRKELGRRE